eukprot:NODE_668_length_5368_cov_0.471626.p2 type:complete len:504 gc:universal NODE_668_length_5368_cov_0.471626:1681-170(-)
MLLAIDQGTTSTRVIIFNMNGTIKYQCSEELSISHPQHGYASVNPNKLYKSVEQCLKQAFQTHPTIKGIGLTNQRETTIFWTSSGHVFEDGIVWYDSRTDGLCNEFTTKYGSEYLLNSTGLCFSTYFSALKIKWMIMNNPEVLEAYLNKTLRVGTVDVFLLYKLTGEYKTDITNASRTMLMNIHTGKWDLEVLKVFGLEKLQLPTIHACDHAFGLINIPYYKNCLICGVLGDQQAAIVGQKCIEAGDCKCTYGTGCFLLMTTDKPIFSKSGLITTVGYELNGVRKYALEGAVSNVGSVITWMTDLGLVKSGKELSARAEEAGSSEGVIFLPFLSGAFAPYWKPSAKGCLLNISNATNTSHIAYAFYESIAIQINTVLNLMAKEAKLRLSQIKVDGGVCNSNILMQLQSNMSQLPVLRPNMRETTALGCAVAAGISLKLYKLEDEIINHCEHFLPSKYDKKVADAWHSAVNISIPSKTYERKLLKFGLAAAILGVLAIKWVKSK